MVRQVNVGIVGLGYWGPNLVRNFSSVQDCSVKAVCDKNPRRLDHIGRLYPAVKGLAEYEEMVSDPGIDAIVIATPAPLHHSLGRRALENGKHVFVEKPMAMTCAECHDLVCLAESRGLTLMVGHTFLYSPPVRKIKEIVANGDIGSICYISSRRLNLGLFQKDLNVVWDLAPHDISIICYIMGESPNALNCQGHAHLTPHVEDVSNMTLYFPAGGFATIQNSWLDPRKVREMTIVGTRRMIVYDDLEPLQKIRIYDVRVETPPHYDTFAQFQFSYHYGDMYAPRIEQEEALKVECSHFVDCIRSRGRPLSSGVEGRDLVCVLEAASRSLKSDGSRVAVNYALPAAAAAAPAAPASKTEAGKHRRHVEALVEAL